MHAKSFDIFLIPLWIKLICVIGKTPSENVRKQLILEIAAFKQKNQVPENKYV